MMGEAPKIESLLLSKERSDEIQSFVKANPCKDHIYYFPNKNIAQGYTIAAAKEDCVKLNIFELLNTTEKLDIVVAGSAALSYLQTIVFQNANRINWKASDTDIFFLKSIQNNRYSLGTTDLVHAKEKSVEELLLNFDLGCCRVAFDFQLNFWVSAQCLNAIFTHKFPMPKYLKDKNSFDKTLNLYRGENILPGAEEMMYRRFTERIRKYSNRGFGVKWVDTKIILPWVKNRFHYAEWKIEEEKQNIIKENDVKKAYELLKNHFGYNPLVGTFMCYECGDVEPKPESQMQKYDCRICGGRKCEKHTSIDENFKCDECGTDQLCNSCLEFRRCCHDFVKK